MRTDVHRPSAIVPEDYDFVECHYVGTAELDPFEIIANAEAMQRINAHMARTGGRYSQHEHGGTCHVCGATALYLAVFYHPSTNSYIQMGEDCAEKLDMGDVEAFNPLRRAIKNARNAKAGRLKAAALLADCGLARLWELYDGDGTEELVTCGYMLPYTKQDGTQAIYWSREWSILADMVTRLIRHGKPLSEKQVTFANKLMHDAENRAEVLAQRAAEKASAPDVPTGKQVITGTVIKTEVRDGAYGTEYKLTVKDDRGFVLWGSIPSSLQLVDIERHDNETTWTESRGLRRGDRVAFSATVQRSDRDPKFGFYKRPTQAKVIALSE